MSKAEKQEEPPNSAELTQRAWERWFDMDFSWKGLARPYYPKIIGEDGKEQALPEGQEPIDLKNPDNYSQSLQEYWLADPMTGEERPYEQLVRDGEIIECLGEKEYHVVHLPEYYDNNFAKPTARIKEPERIKEKIEKVISSRISALRRADGEAPKFQSLWLSGCVLPELNLTFIADKDEIDIKCHDTIFLGDFYFYKFGALYGVDAQRSHFCGNVSFMGGKSSGFINLEKSNFLLSFDCRQTDFTGFDAIECKFFGVASFLKSSISSFDINDCQFFSKAEFSQLRSDRSFVKKSEFHNTFDAHDSFASFSLYIGNCKFFEDADLRNCRIENFVIEDVLFDKRIFLALSQFGNTLFDEVKITDTNINLYIFSAVTFNKLTEFSNSNFAYSAFGGAIFNVGANIQRKLEADYENQFKAELRLTRRKFDERGNHTSKQIRNERIAFLEAGCRTLKRATAMVADKSMEQLFYRFELKARRHQSISLSEFFISHAYSFCSKYGASYFQPVALLFSVCVVFSIAYWPLSDGASWPYIQNIAEELSPALRNEPGARSVLSKVLKHPTPPIVNLNQVDEVINMSASRIFPFGLFGEDSEALEINARKNGVICLLLFRAGATLESFFAIILAFLFGVAIKRRFQIN